MHTLRTAFGRIETIVNTLVCPTLSRSAYAQGTHPQLANSRMRVDVNREP